MKKVTKSSDMTFFGTIRCIISYNINLLAIPNSNYQPFL